MLVYEDISPPSLWGAHKRSTKGILAKNTTKVGERGAQRAIDSNFCSFVLEILDAMLDS